MSDSRALAATAQAGQHMVNTRAGGRIPNRNPVCSSEAPLSHGQESIWLEEQASPGSSSYNISAAFRIRGPLSISALQWAFAEIIRRHEILRTTFHLLEDVPRQVISPPQDFVLATDELPGGTDEARIAGWVEQQTTAPFDLTAGPLLRVRLLRAGNDDHVVAVSMHHIISDGWSQLVLLREMMMLYEAHCRRTTPLLPVLDIQYADFAVWQREFLKSETIEQQLAYWKQALADAPPLLSLPLDRPRPPVHTRRGAIEPFSIPKPVVEKLRQIGRHEDATLFITLMAAFQTLLHQYSGQDDIVVGTPYLGRNSQQLAGSIGLFLNTLAIRVRFDGSCSFRDILRRTREVCLGAFANSAVPFARVVAAVNPAREASYNPIFQAWFLLENRSTQSMPASPGLEIVPLASVDGSAKFDLLFVANESSSSINGHLRYNTDLFRPETIKTMAAAFTTLVRLLVDLPDTPCNELPISPAILMQEPDTESEAGKDQPVESRFEQIAARNPLQVAVLAEGNTWNYGELNKAANRLARRLQELGAKPESAVVVRVERSVNSVLAMLAIQKAGAVYVPVDVAEPQERVRQILETVQPVVVITQKNLSGEFGPSSNSSVVCIDCSDSELERASDENLPVPADVDNLAYVIFTSGSTGKPKGVAVSRSALASHCSRIIRRFRLTDSDRVLQFANTAFDVSIEQVLPTLAVGAAVYVRGNTQWSAAELFSVIQEWRLTVANLPTAYWQTVTAEWSRSQLRLHSDFRLMIIGGEAMSPAAAEKWLSCGQHGELWNAYGPTEAVITTSFLTVAAGVSKWAGSCVPVDKPLPDRWGMVLNERLQPVPAGAPGELCIGGNLARGYVGMAVETAERFVPNPFAETEGERLYRTGDVVRLRPDDTLDFLGRRDYQIKLRGYRIELEEIESALKKIAGVGDAVTKIWQSEDAQPRLVAYVTSSSAPLRDEEVREKLKALLPEFMMPSAIVMLESMPMTISGKIDRHSLPAPVAPVSNTAAQDSMEEEVLELFKKILRVPSIGRTDDFFEAGGHSLLAVQLVGKIRERFGLKVSLATIFRLRTGSALAGELRELKRKEPVKQKAGAEAAIRRADRRGPLPLSYAQERLWFVEQLQPGGAAYNMPIALRLRGPLDVGALEQAFTRMVQRHEILRTSFAVMEGVPRQIISPAPEFPLAVLEMAGEAEVQKWLEQEMAKGFNLERGPLLRVHVLRLGEQEHVLAIVLHHIICDGWSLNVLLREMVTLYEGQRRGEGEGLPELELQYGDYAVWQREWLQGEVLEQQLRYWKRQLGGAPGLLKLPLDRERPVQPSRRGATVGFTVGEGLLQELRRVSQGEGATLFMTLVAAFQVLLHYYSGQSDIVVGTDDANRQRGETEGLIGFFINQLALRTDLSGNPSFRKVLQRVRQTTLDAYVHNAAPFEKVVEALNIQRSLQHSPVFQVQITMQNAVGEGVAVTGLALEPYGALLPSSKFDLTLFITEEAQQLRCALNYSTELFTQETITKYRKDFLRILEAVSVNPDLAIQELASAAGIAVQPNAYTPTGLREIRPAPIA